MDTSEIEMVSIELGPDDIRPVDQVIRQRNEKGGIHVTWSHRMTQLLIVKRIEMEDDFKKPIPKKNLWTKISKVLAAKDFHVSSDECSSKWRNLMSTYKLNKEKTNTDKTAVIKWPYFSVLNEQYGAEDSAQNLLVSMSASTLSAFMDANSSSSTAQKDTVSPLQVASTTVDGKRKAKRKLARGKWQEGGPPAWFTQFMKKKEEEDKVREERRKEQERWKEEKERIKNEKEEKRWKEYKELEEKKTNAMLELIALMKK